MQYEFEDNRPPQPKPKWLEWTPTSPRKYLVFQFMLNFIVPSLLGVSLTTMGLLINFVLVDWIIYIQETRTLDSE
tara:strand:+ start:79 stop:303 length:225 start_codon:yes stop_codon:yes gene_type:complete